MAKRFVMFTLICVLMVGLMILIYLFFIRDTENRRVVAVTGGGAFSNRVEGWSDSFITMRDDGIFLIELVYRSGDSSTRVLTGIGRFESSGGRDNPIYTFTYIDKWLNQGGAFVQVAPVVMVYQRSGNRLLITIEGTTFEIR